MSLSTAGKYISLSAEMAKTNILTAMEYRMTFIVQVAGMIVNDIALILIWVLFFARFGEVRGWTFSDTALLYAITTVNFGIMMSLSRGSYELARIIARGELDYFLALPKNVLWHVSMSKSEISAIGDTIFGLGILFFSGPMSASRLGLFAVYVMTGIAILWGFTVIVQSASFWLGNFEEAAEQIFHMLIGFTLYPQSVFYGLLKLVMMTLIPAFFIATLPVQLIRNFDPGLSLLLAVYAVIMVTAAKLIFEAGLRKYESGNLINVRI